MKWSGIIAWSGRQGGHIPQSATRIHGVDTETVKTSPGIEMVLPEFLGFIQNRILIGHNVAEYDNPILAPRPEKVFEKGFIRPALRYARYSAQAFPAPTL